MLIHQLAREVWWYESPFPLSALGYVAEPLYLRLYRHLPVVTVSQSTSDDLRRLGFKNSIRVIPEGIEPIPVLDSRPPRTDCFLYVGRLAPSKRIEHMIRAIHLYRQATGSGALWLVGSGSDRYRRSLERLARQLEVAESVKFLGRVSVAEKYKLMASCKALLMTSVREGWGLVVSEANACGTPAVVYDVPGLRDSVRNGSTGLVVPPIPSKLAEGMITLSSNGTLYLRLASEAKRWSATLSFDEAARLVALELDRVNAA